MQRFVFVPMVATFSCLFCGVQAFCVKCQNSSQLFFVLFSIWCPSIIIDGHASSDQSPGLMAIKVDCFSCLSLIWVLWVRCCHISSLHHVCEHDVCVVLRSSSMFLVSFCYVVMGEKIIIIALSQQDSLEWSSIKKKHMISYWQSGA